MTPTLTWGGPGPQPHSQKCGGCWCQSKSRQPDRAPPHHQATPPPPPPPFATAHGGAAEHIPSLRVDIIKNSSL